MTVLVTGAAGYLASWIVRLLLEAGVQVHGSVRDLDDAAKLAHLHALQQAFPGQLQLFVADLLNEGSFLPALHGCEIVIHTASPYFLRPTVQPVQQLVDPAVQGTRQLLAAVNQVASVRKVVLTSSIVTLFNDACDHAGPLTEAHHNNRCTLRDQPYAYAKTRAEECAVGMAAAQQRWQLITLHPGAIFGPSLSRRIDATSVGMLLQFLDGAFRSGVPRLTLAVVDVRDVAMAHVRAALQPVPAGKYLLVGQSLTLLEISRLLQAVDGRKPGRLPTRELPKALLWLLAPLIGMTRRYVKRNVGYPLQFDNRHARTALGIQYRPAQTTLNDHVRQLLLDGLWVPQ
ncbi:hypothetical protein IGB42_04062 [Andreprevotia sp. IGB-42]|uniref:NAD-dependent epimerase/dehydratase family protein n=1 Tax=Andreprevotia sp. IGB-42 TaxID=2497473 RepID=UPI001357E818|nr:NAD-dependent epimerase/dehydratase family protein [Andreprevotia sp. IGB-42]KAF0811444.1 hypothetical protein IGB42_04062 [Andreprevotia sp. IGB-42]